MPNVYRSAKLSGLFAEALPKEQAVPHLEAVARALALSDGAVTAQGIRSDAVTRLIVVTQEVKAAVIAVEKEICLLPVKGWTLAPLTDPDAAARGLGELLLPMLGRPG